MEWVRVDETVEAPIEAVWELVGDFAGVERWHPHILSCRVDTDQGATTRTVRFANWWLTEQLECCCDKTHELTYHLVASSRPAVIGARATISLVERADGHTSFRWHTMCPATGAQRLASYYRSRIEHARAALRTVGPLPRSPLPFNDRT